MSMRMGIQALKANEAKSYKPKAAFTLVELLVIVTIITLVSSVILANYRQLGSNFLLGNIAYDIALSIRQAQVYGISTREVGSGTGVFTAAYGVFFDMTTPSTYLFYADTVGDNGIYTSGTDTALQQISLPSGYTLSKICVPSGGPCGSGSDTSLNITFKRPNPDARLNATINGTPLTNQADALIELSSSSGKKRTVMVQDTGQISIPQ